MVDVGLRWTRDPFDACSEVECLLHKVRVLSFSIEEEEAPPAETAGEVAAVTSVVAIGVSVVVNTAAGSAMGATSMGFVQQLQFSGILARLKGCPDEFKTFSSGFDWTLLDWPLPWEKAFRLPWEDSVDDGAAFSEAHKGKIVDIRENDEGAHMVFVKVNWDEEGEPISVNWGDAERREMTGRIVSAEQKINGVVVLADEECERNPTEIAGKLCKDVGNAKYERLKCASSQFTGACPLDLLWPEMTFQNPMKLDVVLPTEVPSPPTTSKCDCRGELITQSKEGKVESLEMDLKCPAGLDTSPKVDAYQMLTDLKLADGRATTFEAKEDAVKSKLKDLTEKLADESKLRDLTEKLCEKHCCQDPLLRPPAPPANRRAGKGNDIVDASEDDDQVCTRVVAHGSFHVHTHVDAPVYMRTCMDEHI